MGPALFVSSGFSQRLPEDTEDAGKCLGAFVVSRAERIAGAGVCGWNVHLGTSLI